MKDFFASNELNASVSIISNVVEATPVLFSMGVEATVMIVVVVEATVMIVVVVTVELVICTGKTNTLLHILNMLIFMILMHMFIACYFKGLWGELSERLLTLQTAVLWYYSEPSLCKFVVLSTGVGTFCFCYCFCYCGLFCTVGSVLAG